MKNHIITRVALSAAAMAGCATSLCALQKSGAQQKPDPRQRPNVLVVLTDQQSWDMVSAISGYPYLKTPNMDRLVKRGFSFTNAWCANPLSLPSRWAMITGESTAGYDLQNNAAPESRKAEIQEVARTRSVGSLFRKAGYDTYYIGKTHLAWGNDRGETGDPVNYNFTLITNDDRQKGAMAGAEFFRDHKASKPFLIYVSLINPHDIGRDRIAFMDEPPKGDKNGLKGADANTLKYKDRIAELGNDFFMSEKSDPLPFNYGATDTHPLSALFKKTYGGYSDLEWKKYVWFYHRLVEQVDAEIGLVLDALDASPYRDNTVVLFTSDHGDMAGAHHLAKKNIMYNECQRVPWIMAGPGVRNRIDRTTPVCNGWDMLPTLCSIAGIEKPKEIRGLSLWDYVTKGDALPARDYLYLESVNGFEIIEQGRWAFLKYELKGQPEVLFDLEKDPGQMHNLIDEEPFRAKADELRAILLKEVASRGITMTENRPFTLSGLVPKQNK
ncbi:sulfatase [Bacteroidia bacterium]|nr:sulfatase [Bacteroidia bacterium]